MKRIYKSCAAVLAVGVMSLATMPAPIVAQTQNQTAPAATSAPESFDLAQSTQPVERSATAVVNGYVITGTDIDQRVALVTSASQNQLSAEETARLRAQVLRNLIDETIKIQAAAAQEIPAERAVVEQTYRQLAVQNFGDNPERMDEYLRSIGSSPNALKRQIEGEMAWDNLLRRNVIPFVNVSAEEVNEVLRRMEEDRGTEEYRVGEIYLSATRENRATVLQNAQAIMEQLRQGGNFVAYARQYSEATTAVTGGDLGWIRLGMLPQQLDDALLTMQPGQLNGPIEIPGGFSILYLINKRQVLMADPNEAILNLKQVSIDFDPDMDQAQLEARATEFAQFVSTITSCEDAERATDAIGATVVSNEQLTAGGLPPQLRSMVLNLQVGQATQPFGSAEEGVRILMLCGRQDAEDAGAPSFEQVMNQIEEERIDKRAQRYLRDLRNDAYIETN